MDKILGRSRVSGTVHTPCSKSYAQRALACALLCGGRSVIDNLELCDDTRHAINAVEALGAGIEPLGRGSYAVRGGLSPKTDIINTGESGLSARLFTPIASLCDEKMTVTGTGTMLRRPIGMMVKPLENLGVKVETDGFLPVSVSGPLRGGETVVDGFVSSQFVTGLLTALPLAVNDSSLHVEYPNSIPYIMMTVDVLRRFGITIEHSGYNEFFIPANQKFKPIQYSVEGDWGAAAFMLAAGAIAGEVAVMNMNPVSLQADLAIIDALSRAGASITTTNNEITVTRGELRGFEFDATHCPDLFPVLAALAASCTGTSTIRGASRLIHKESDRAKAIVSEFTRLGIDVAIEDDTMTVRESAIHGGTVDSHHDHRIAMAAAIVALNSSSPITIRHAEAVSKSYPGFWEELDQLTMDN